MRTLPPMKDMRLTDQDREEDVCFPCPPDLPAYPYGLCVSLTEKELDKLGVKAVDFDVGDMVHLQCMAVVSCVSENKKQDGDYSCRIELQITHIAEEDEDEEGRDIVGKLYK